MTLMNKIQPIDRISISLMILFSFIISILIWGETTCSQPNSVCPSFFHTGPRVRDFSWEGRQIGAEDQAFILTFDRPMAQKSVEENLVIKPNLPGRISWAGRRLAYTLDQPPTYGESYEISLEGAKEKFLGQAQEGKLIQPFKRVVNTRDRALAYIGIEGEEQGRLVLFNWTKKEKRILTPSNLIVTDFQFYPQGEKVLFSAVEGRDTSIKDIQLYTVSTELEQSQTNVELILDNQEYQTLKFQLSQDGKNIVVQRLNRNKPADFGLWIIQGNNVAKPLNNQPGGDFLIAPDSQTVAMSQGEGVAILPLQPNAEPLDFLARFGQVMTFSRDGRSAVMVNFNTDNIDLRYTRSLYLVNNQGGDQKILDTDGSIIDCEFNPSATVIYCFLTNLVEGGEEYKEQPYLTKIDLNGFKEKPLFQFTEYQDFRLSMANDGFGILFEQIATGEGLDIPEALRTNSGALITDSRILLLLIDNNVISLEELPFKGIRPQWLP
jgi:dipeptidyl aminopeptidase/acylaminoacyl peptidase